MQTVSMSVTRIRLPARNRAPAQQVPSFSWREAAGCLWRTHAQHAEKRDCKGQRVQQQGPLNPDAEEEQRAQRRPDNQRDILRHIIQPEGTPAPLLLDHIAGQRQPGGVKELRADAREKDHTIDHAQLPGSR